MSTEADRRQSISTHGLEQHECGAGDPLGRLEVRDGRTDGWMNRLSGSLPESMQDRMPDDVPATHQSSDRYALQTEIIKNQAELLAAIVRAPLAACIIPHRACNGCGEMFPNVDLTWGVCEKCEREGK